MYSAPYSPETMAAYFPAIGADQAPFYANPAVSIVSFCCVQLNHLSYEKKTDCKNVSSETTQATFPFSF